MDTCNKENSYRAYEFSTGGEAVPIKLLEGNVTQQIVDNEERKEQVE